ncbi:MAG TPA: hypothetical protein VEQ87_03825 [Burkholderiales bacterium]|nr:hypothetical protein [Burkholderiales bacterium]
MRALALLLLIAGSAAAQAPAPAPEPKAAERRPLNLRLEEPVSSEPRITFGPRDGKPEQRPADTLPTLGGAPSRAYERPLNPDSPASPFPKDTNPGL